MQTAEEWWSLFPSKEKKNKLKSGTVKMTARIHPSCAWELHMLKLVLTRFISDGLEFSVEN